MYNDYNEVRAYLAHFGISGQKKGIRRFQSYQVAPTQSGMTGQEVGEAAKQRARLHQHQKGEKTASEIGKKVGETIKSGIDRSHEYARGNRQKIAKAASTIGNAAKKGVTGAAKGYGNHVKKASSTYANKYKDMAKTAANIYTSSPVGASTPAGIYTANQKYRKVANSKAGMAAEALHQVASPNYRMAKTAQNVVTAAKAVNKARKKKGN